MNKLILALALGLGVVGQVHARASNDPISSPAWSLQPAVDVGFDSDGNLYVGTITVPSGSNVALFVATHPASGFPLFRLDSDRGAFFVMPATQTIAASGTITADACGGIKRITAGAPVTTDTTNTITKPDPRLNRGCEMLVVNVGTNTITLDANALFLSTHGVNGNGNYILGSSDTVRVFSLGGNGVSVGGSGGIGWAADGGIDRY